MITRGVFFKETYIMRKSIKNKNTGKMNLAGVVEKWQKRNRCASRVDVFP